MKVEIMETVAKNGKPIWDTIVAIGGASAIFLQSTMAIEIQVWAQVFGGFGLGIFTLVRAYYWVKHNGYEDERP